MTAALAVDGADRVAAALQDAARRLVAGDPATAAAMSRAMLGAVHAPRRTGALAGTVRAELTDPRQPGITAGTPGIRYAAVHEWGSPARGITASAYLRRALEGSSAAWLAAYSAGVTDTLARIT